MTFILLFFIIFYSLRKRQQISILFKYNKAEVENHRKQNIPKLESFRNLQQVA